jgi:sugar O-acyltransferase (sialic acid O-acetyltransferase NeuD family)
VLGDDTVLARHLPTDVQLAVGIGGVRGESLRRRIHERLKAAGWTLAAVRHPSAIVSPSAQLGEGVQVMAGAIVQPGARIGDGAIVNTAAVVEHDCDVGAFVHVAPRALLCGDVRVGAGTHVGAGAVVRQAAVIGEGVVIAAGAVVVRDFPGPGMLAGVPAAAMDRTQ